MFVGESGVERIVQRTAELMKQDPNEDARAQGGIDLPTIQKYVNFWYSSSMDLFGGEISSNAAEYFASGLKGREREERHADHVALEGSYALDVLENGKLEPKDIPMRNAMNEILRDAYSDDNQRGVDRWNKMIADAGVDFRLRLPSKRFNRTMGIYAGHHFDLDVTSEALPGVVRSFTSLSAAAEEATLSRIFAGQHFRFDETNGQRLGRDVADFVLDNFLTPRNERDEDGK